MAFTVKGKGKAVALKRRHQRVRKTVSGTPERPRLVVRRSNRHMFAQVIDDVAGHTLAAASSVEDALRDSGLNKTEAARRVGELVAERCKTAGVESVVFDRGGNKYHGRVAAVAEGARSGGLKL